MGEKFQKGGFFFHQDPPPSIKQKKNLGPPYSIGELFQCPPRPPPPPPLNYDIRFNIITTFSILLNTVNTFLHEPATLPLPVVVIYWGCSSSSDVSSELRNSSIISSSESSLVASVSSSHIGRAVKPGSHMPPTYLGRGRWHGLGQRCDICEHLSPIHNPSNISPFVLPFTTLNKGSWNRFLVSLNSLH